MNRSRVSGVPRTWRFLHRVNVGALDALTDLVASARCHSNERRDTMHKGRVVVFVALGLITAGIR
jgi:hypothetical protein